MRSWLAVIGITFAMLGGQVFARWHLPLDGEKWIANGSPTRARMAKDVSENVLSVGMSEDDVCQLLGPDNRGRCGSTASLTPKDSQWRMGRIHSPILPWMSDEQQLMIIYDEDRTVAKWLVLHPLPRLSSPLSWYIPW